MVKTEQLKQAKDLLETLQEHVDYVCAEQHCTEEEWIESSQDGTAEDIYAYITKDLNVLDICTAGFFQGTSEPYAAISLPIGCMTTEELLEEIEEQTYQNG